MSSSKTKELTKVAIYAIIDLLLIMIVSTTIHAYAIKSIPLGIYGAWISLQEFIIMPTIIKSLHDPLLQKLSYYYGKKNYDYINKLLGTGSLAILSCFIPIFIILIIVGAYLPVWMSVEKENYRVFYTLYYIVLGIILVHSTMIGIVQDLCCAMNVPQIIAKHNFILRIIAASLTFVGLYFGLGIYGCTLFFLIPLGGFGISCLFICRKLKRMNPNLKVGFCKEEYQKLVRLSFLSLGSGISGLLNSLGAPLITILISPQHSLIYLFTRKLTDLVKVITENLPEFTAPSFAHILASETSNYARKIFCEINHLRFSITAIFITIYFVFNQQLIVLWVGEKFYGGPLLTIFIGINFLVSGQYSLINVLYRYTGEHKFGGMLSLIECMVRTLLMLIFIKLWGLIGVPIAQVVSSSMALGIIMPLVVKKMNAQRKILYYFMHEYKIFTLSLIIITIGLIGCLFHRCSLSLHYIILSVIAISILILTLKIIYNPYFYRIRTLANKFKHNILKKVFLKYNRQNNI